MLSQKNNPEGPVLVLAAHPDDEVLGCGGAIARMALEGRAVFIAILGEGITSRYNDPGDADREQLSELHEKSRAAAALLGAHEVFLEGLPDNRFDTVPLLDVVKRVEALIEKLKPVIVFTQHGGDLNVDHQITFRATLTATRPMLNGPVQEVYAYEVGSSTEWAFQQFAPKFQPQVFMDIADTLELKIRAMELYESEARMFPHPRSPEALRAQAQCRGAQSGLLAAEAFQCVCRIVR